MRGVVRSLVADKGFGFIRVLDGTEYFFHRTSYLGFWDDLTRDAQKGQVEVEFEATKSPKGPRAENVKRINEITG